MFFFFFSLLTDGKQGKAKRVRTTFTEEQLQILQANFEVDSNPDGQDLERIAQITGIQYSLALNILSVSCLASDRLENSCFCC